MKTSDRSRLRLRRWLLLLAGVVAAYALLAYVVLPLLWKHYEHHPSLERAPKTTMTADGIAGDPLNVGAVGTRAEMIGALVAAGWQPADAITFGSSLEIAESVLLHRPDSTAPVSALYLWGRKQDLAFERQAGTSARRRHHVRLWAAPELGTDEQPLWIGAATFDDGVGVSHYTGQITHHIAPNVDAERDTLMSDLLRARRVQRMYQVTGVGSTLNGRNGEGDWYYTDGELSVAVLSPSSEPERAPVILPNPPAVRVKQRFWRWLRSLLP